MVKSTRRFCWRNAFLWGALLGGVLAAAGAGRSAETGQKVDLELVLAVDVSDSVDLGEARLQRQGYLAALTDPGVLAAIRSGPLGRVAVSYAEWAGLGHYRVVVDWQAIDGEDSAQAFASRLAAAPLHTARRTSISDAIELSAARFDDNGYDGTRRVIDISGDGPNNYGALVTKARDAAVRRGITINGLAILADPSEPENRGGLRRLDLYYEDCVIGGPGAFVVVANGHAAFADAIRRKMMLEIAGHAWARLWRAALTRAAEERPPCNIGEWLWFGADR